MMAPKINLEEGWWKSEFQYLLDRKILSRDELAYLFGQIKSVIDKETKQAHTEAKNLRRVAKAQREYIKRGDFPDSGIATFDKETADIRSKIVEFEKKVDV